jgi:hypothetical protein
MKCYVHHDVDAVGVCSKCGQGICDACAVRIGGRLYCKADADSVFSKQGKQGVSIQRTMRVEIASVFFLLYGIFGIGIGLVFLVAGFVTGLVSSIPFYPSQVPASLGLLGLGGLLLVMGILGVICSVWLWRVQVWGAAVGIPLVLVGIIIGWFLVASSPVLITYELTVTIWTVNASLFALLVASWSKLQSFGEGIPDF